MMAITVEDIKKLSPRMKAFLLFIACALVAYFYYAFYLQAALEKKGDLDSRLTQLKQDVQTKEKIASQKTKFLQELKNLRGTFQVALTKLPDKMEIPGLFESVSLAGRNSGIEFLLFEPVPVPQVKKVETKDKDKNKKPGEGENAADDEKFYTDIPIKVKIIGSFQNTLEFFDKVSKLPRIINVENLAMDSKKDAKAKEGAITTSCVVKTYMFLDKDK
ncbi:MAG TPA: type 4a pilus biogenesis protein PilO [Syntrophales bacterium]|jgi:type IV pilus assembly protein PilO|nr:type 4a pilus biogenesis protein PilO [Syntrophales bacterium]